MRSEEGGRPDVSSTLTIAYEFERGGQFSKALHTLEQGNVRVGEKRGADVLRAQLLERTGKYGQSRSLMDSLLRMKDLSAADRSACELVAARLAWDGAKIDSAILHLQRSIEYGKRAGNLERVCWSQLRLMSMLRDTLGVEAAAALLAELRTNATKLGQAVVLSAVHIFIGQMEAQRGLFASARRHTTIGLKMLSTSPNLWLEATAENVNFGISVLLSDLDSGLIQGKRALHLAEGSGAASTIGTSLGNMGNLYYLLGQFDEAVEYHQRALALVTPGGENWNGGLESLAQIRLAQGRPDECGALLDEIGSAVKTDADQRRYIYRYALLTRAKWFARLGQYGDALSAVDATLMLAHQTGDHLLASMGLLTKAELLVAVDQYKESLATLDSIVADLPRLPPEFHAQHERILGKALLRTGRVADAACHFERTERICRAIKHAPGLLDVSESLADVRVSAANSVDNQVERYSAHNILQSIATLLIHHDHPEILAREFVSLLGHTGAVASAKAVLRRVDGGAEIVASIEQPATSDTFSSFVSKEFMIAVAGECRIEIGVLAKPDIESTATLNAITLLLNAIHDLERARAEREERATLWPIDELTDQDGDAIITGHMREQIGLARKIGPTNVSVLITGESGTGKEIIARALHTFSTRAAKPFIPFNCAAIPREMLESQLFGHRRGAFTGADRDQPGVIRSARDGTVFLDEIGDMSLDLQPKILRFLESGEISPLGEPSPLHVNVRVVAATNAKLETLVREGRFREDLYYRLNVFRLTLKPLRERRDEIPALVNAFVARAAAEFRKGHMRVAEETMEHLLVYPWPGNVRQLLNETRRMVALADPDSTLVPTDISSDIRATLPAFPSLNADGRQIAVPLRDKLTSTLAKIECEMIKMALRDHGGRVDAAAKALGISRKGLYLKRQRLGL